MLTDLAARTLIDQQGRVRYWDDFLGGEEADRHMEAALDSVRWREEHVSMYGKTHAIPRLSAWYSDSQTPYRYSGIVMRGCALPRFLDRLRAKIVACTGREFNSVLLNYYRDGRDKVGWHSDDETELGADPCIASLSLGVPRVFRLRHKETRIVHSVLLAHGSLLLMEPPLQTHWQHCLPAVSGVSAARINLSFRHLAV